MFHVLEREGLSFVTSNTFVFLWTSVQIWVWVWVAEFWGFGILTVARVTVYHQVFLHCGRPCDHAVTARFICHGAFQCFPFALEKKLQRNICGMYVKVMFFMYVNYPFLNRLADVLFQGDFEAMLLHVATLCALTLQSAGTGLEWKRDLDM